MTITMIGHKGIPARSGGIERHVEELSAGLVRLGARVISFDRAWYVGNAPSPVGVTRRFSYGLRTKHLDAITHTLSALVLAMKDRPDVVHVHGVGPSLLLPMARVLHPKARVISTFHCVDRTHAKWGFVARLLLRLGEWCACTFAHRTIAVSDALAAYCLDVYECQPAVVPNGVCVPEDVSAASLTAFGVEPKRYFLMATRLVPHKNVHIAMEAHALFAKRNPHLAASYPLLVAGGSSWTDDYANELRAWSAQSHTRLVGEQHGDTLAALQAHAACHLSVSSSEGMSIALLEALAHARPAIVSDIPENTELTGDLAPAVPVGDVRSLSYAMEYMAFMNDAERDALGTSLRNRIRDRHDWNRIAEATYDVYRENPGTGFRSRAVRRMAV
ncbi:MAG: hypothetical protein RL141_677 [Candidatus Parcubacteria bacterium]|jgi:glycosyltransferase involved in cell wall biosynthesis